MAGIAELIASALNITGAILNKFPDAKQKLNKQDYKNMLSAQGAGIAAAQMSGKVENEMMRSRRYAAPIIVPSSGGGGGGGSPGGIDGSVQYKDGTSFAGSDQCILTPSTNGFNLNAPASDPLGCSMSITADDQFGGLALSYNRNPGLPHPISNIPTSRFENVGSLEMSSGSGYNMQIACGQDLTLFTENDLFVQSVGGNIEMATPSQLTINSPLVKFVSAPLVGGQLLALNASKELITVPNTSDTRNTLSSEVPAELVFNGTPTYRTFIEVPGFVPLVIPAGTWEISARIEIALASAGGGARVHAFIGPDSDPVNSVAELITPANMQSSPGTDMPDMNEWTNNGDLYSWYSAKVVTTLVPLTFRWYIGQSQNMNATPTILTRNVRIQAQPSR